MDPAAVAGPASVLLAAAGIAWREDRAVQRVIDGLARPSTGSNRRPTGLVGALGRTRVGRRAATGERLERLRVLAGSPWSREQLGGLRLLACSAGAGLGLVIGPPSVSLISVPALGAVGFFLPQVLLSRRARRRQKSIELRVPDLVEVLVATAEAGLAPAVALSRAPNVLHGPLAQEVERVSGEIELGVPWREALHHLVERTDVPSLRRLVAALTRSSRLGSSVRTALRSVADDLRSTRRVRAEELARRAPVKMLFPLVFLILPAFLLLTVGPAVLATLRSLQSGG
jgi:tight adherence protein C